MAETAEELRGQAARLRQSAQYADGPAYREEMARARQLEVQAWGLDGAAKAAPTAVAAKAAPTGGGGVGR